MKKESVGIRMPKELANRIREYQKENYLTSFSQAVIQLLSKALEK